SSPTDMLQHHPQFESPEAASLLEPIFREPWETSKALAFFRPEIGRHQAKCFAKDSTISNECATTFSWNGEPFMWIQSNRIGLVNAGVAWLKLRIKNAKGSVSSIDVEPKFLVGTELGQSF